MTPLFTVYRSAKRRRSGRSAANSSNVSNQPLRRARTCPPGYPHHTLSNVTAHRNRPAPPRMRDRRNARSASLRQQGIIERRRTDGRLASHRTRRMPTAFRRSSNACARSGVALRRRNISPAMRSRRRWLRSMAALRYLRLSFAFNRIPTRCTRSRSPLPHPGRSSTRGRRRARIRRSCLLLSHRRSAALRRPLRRHAPADSPASVFVFHSPRRLHVRTS